MGKGEIGVGYGGARWPDRGMAIRPLSGALYAGQIRTTSDRSACVTQSPAWGAVWRSRGAFGAIRAGRRGWWAELPTLRLLRSLVAQKSYL
jgi:hypothetical protein